MKLYLLPEMRQIKPVIVDANKDRLVVGVPYTGSITFGIEIADAE